MPLRNPDFKSFLIIEAYCVVESKKKWYKWTYLETERLTDFRELTYGYQGEEIVLELETDLYTLLYLKCITNKDLLYST